MTRLSVAISIVVTVGLVLFAAIAREPGDAGEDPSATAVHSKTEGWDELLPCSFAASLDGTRHILLYENGQVVLIDQNSVNVRKRTGQNPKVFGAWSFDRQNDRYTISISDEEASFVLVTPAVSNACMLIRGSLGSADLQNSWFAEDLDPND